METAGFLYYSPDPQGRQQKQHGHHGQFLPYVAAASPQLLAPTPISPINYPSQLVLGGRGIPLTITPSASPSLYESYEICADSAASDFVFDPATPPLSHSAMSTPLLPHAVMTPISNHGFSLDEPLVATIAPSDIQLPSTPMEYLPGLPTPEIVKSNAAPTPSFSLNDIHCPALSPCSSQSSFESSDFCDPKALTIDMASPAVTFPECDTKAVFSPMPALSDDDEFIFGTSIQDYLPIASSEKPKPYPFGDYIEELDDLDGSEDEFIQKFSESCHSNKRIKFTTDFENDQLPSPPASAPSSRQGSLVPTKPPKQRKPAKKTKTTETSEMTEEQRLRAFKFGSSDDSEHSSDSSSEKPSVPPMHANVIRRGRKQSLTDDPTKTFVCDQCPRRFRRQEHLKRHFRSLHTEEKPFSCGECGKKFSRSDNLTQHSRIHGTGTVLLSVMTDEQILGSQYGLPEGLELPATPQPLALVVVDPMTAATGDMKEMRSSEDKKARKKRKRSDE